MTIIIVTTIPTTAAAATTTTTTTTIITVMTEVWLPGRENGACADPSEAGSAPEGRSLKPRGLQGYNFGPFHEASSGFGLGRQ